MTDPAKLVIDSALEVDGREDTVQLEVRGHQTQEAPLQEWQDDGGDALARVTGDGRLEVGDLDLAAEAALIEVKAEAELPTTRPQRGLGTAGRIVGAISDAVSWVLHELHLDGESVTGLHTALRAVLRLTATSDTSQAELRAGDFEASNEAGTDATRTGRMTGVQGTVVNKEESYLAEAVGVGARVDNETGGEISTAYGLKVEDMPADADLRYAIHTGQGPTHLGDYLELEEMDAPLAPVADSGLMRIYPKADGRLYARNDQGAEMDLTDQGSDTDAIHVDESGEIDGLTLAALTSDDVFVLESAGNSYAKRKTTLADILAYGGLQFVPNNSGSAASQGDVGLLQYDATYGYEYVTTTAAGAIGQWCVVVEGGADGAGVYVQREGLSQIAYAGSAPSVGDYLITSTTAGRAAAQSYISPAIFAVCVGNGSGGLVAAHLLTNRIRQPLALSNDILRINAAGNFSATGWSGTVNDGAPTSSPVTISTSTGALTDITPVSANEHGHIVIHNLTAGNSALIASISGNDITFVDDAPLASWSNGDSLTSISQTITGGGKVRDIDLSASADISPLAVELGVSIVWRDTGAAGVDWTLHPYESWSSSKAKFTTAQVANQYIRSYPSIPIINSRFGVANAASGSGTGLGIVRATFVVVAAP
jgi:hypothetical protein